MNLNRNILRSGDSLADSDVVNQNFHHLAGQVFHMGVALDDLFALISGKHLGLQIFQIAVSFLDLSFHAFTLFGKVICHSEIVLFTDKAFYFVLIERKQIIAVIFQLLLELCLCFQASLFLLL